MVMAKERKKNVLRFTEVQEYINEKIHWYTYSQRISKAKLADRLGFDKARLSDLRVLDDDGSFKFPLSERILNALIREGVVELDDITGKINQKDERKKSWKRDQEYLQIIHELEATMTPEQIKAVLENNLKKKA